MNDPETGMVPSPQREGLKMSMSATTWKQIPDELAEAKTARILAILAKAEQRINLQRVTIADVENLKAERSKKARAHKRRRLLLGA